MVRQNFKSPFNPPFPSPISPGLAPIVPGSGFYGGFVPPSEIVTGRTPFGGAPIGYNVRVIDDGCNLGLQITIELPFIRLPSVQVVYRNPFCALPPPQEQPDFDEDINIPPPSGTGIYIFFSEGDSYYSQRKPDSDFEYTKITSVWNSNFVEGYYPLGINYPDNRRISITYFADEQVYRRILAEDENSPVFEDNRTGIFTTYANDLIYINTGNTGTPERVSPIFAGLPAFVFWSYQDALFGISPENQDRLQNEQFNRDRVANGEVIKERYKIKWKVWELPTVPYITPSLPPNIMSCCPNVVQNDELLRLIAKRLGVSDYPVNVPKVLTDRSKGTESLENITRFTSYVVKQLDALSGKYPIEIEIKDTNITEEGDQTRTIKIPNMAEALAEVIGELLVLRTESDAILNTVIRCLTEAGAAKQSAIIALDYAKANSEFLGYKGKLTARNVPFTFKPGEPELDKMLVNSEVEVKTFENDDTEDFKDIIEPLLTMAAMYRAANFRNLGATDPTTTLKNLLTNFNRFSDAIDSEIKTDNETRNPDNPIKSDFDAFTEAAERGFIDKPGITDATKPYNRPLEQRPQIREIGIDSGNSNP